MKDIRKKAIFFTKEYEYISSDEFKTLEHEFARKRYLSANMIFELFALGISPDIILRFIFDIIKNNDTVLVSIGIGEGKKPWIFSQSVYHNLVRNSPPTISEIKEIIPEISKPDASMLLRHFQLVNKHQIPLDSFLEDPKGQALSPQPKDDKNDSEWFDRLVGRKRSSKLQKKKDSWAGKLFSHSLDKIEDEQPKIDAETWSEQLYANAKLINPQKRDNDEN